MHPFLLAPVFAFTVTFIVLHVLLRHKIAQTIVDRPNERSLHQIPTPRIGGIALMGGVVAGWGMMSGAIAWPLVTGLGLLMALSLADDWRGLPVMVRLLAQALITGGYLFLGVPQLNTLAAFLGASLAMLWMVNLYNFMDGADGLAGGMTVFGFGAYALAAWLAGDPPLASVSLCVAAAAIAFLRFNFHPAKAFMGDAGSVPLGFLAAAIGLAGIIQDIWPGWFPIVVFSPFIVDATVTLGRRLIRGERFWRAHRSHYYQRMVRMGWGHKNTALWEYALMALSGAVALAALKQSMQIQVTLLAVLGLLYLILILEIDRRWASFSSQREGGDPCA